MAEKKTNKPEVDLTLSTEKVDEILRKENLGLKLKMHEKLWMSNMPGVRKPNLKFAMTKDEIEEYTKCKLSVHYFANNHCQIKREDGTIGQMKLRDYQKDIIDLYNDNRYSILMASRQMGKCFSLITDVNILQENGDIIKKPLFRVLKQTILQYRSLTFLEKIKFYLYELLLKIK
jgi:hypothetical protein